jgi:hypothetical protein
MMIGGADRWATTSRWCSIQHRSIGYRRRPKSERIAETGKEESVMVGRAVIGAGPACIAPRDLRVRVLQRERTVMDDNVTRRVALTRFAALAAGVATAGLLPVSAQAAVIGGFDARRRTIFRALVETCDGRGMVRAAGRDVPGEMARRYNERAADYREWVDALLDALDVAADGARFSARGVDTRRALMRGWLAATEPADALLYRPRPSDADEPHGLQASNAMNLEASKRFMASLPADARELDPATGLPRYQPPTPTWPQISDGLGPTGTPVRLRRQLAHSSYVLTASFFSEDVRSLTVEAI